MVAAEKDGDFTGGNRFSAELVGTETALADKRQAFLQTGVGQGVVTGDGDVAAVNGRMTEFS